MTKKVFGIIFAILFFSASSFPQTAPVEEDFQLWSDASITIPLLKAKDEKGKEFDRLTFSLIGTWRPGRNFSRVVDKRIDLSFTYRFNKHLTFTPDYLYRSSLSARNAKQYEHRVRFALTPEKKWERFGLSDRNQIEYRIRNSRDDTVFYRNRLRFDYFIKKNKKELFTPFISNEIHYDIPAKEFVRNQFFAGVSKKFSKTFATELYYIYINDDGFPKTIKGIGISLKFRLNEFKFR